VPGLFEGVYEIVFIERSKSLCAPDDWITGSYK
jgi:hypothetical protein